MNTAPLQGIKVVDFTNVQSGPSCTQLLAWLGAEVIKIERPGTGDATRNEIQFDPKEPSYYFLQLNSDKKSIALDAATPDGKAILTKLIEGADVFIENLHPGAMDKLGFSWEEVHKINPRCVYATIKGFPLSSKYANLKAYEPVAQVTAGAASTTGWYEGEYNIPTQSGAALGDSNTGMHCTIGILAALLQRQHTGEGSFVYQSMHNACLNLCRIKTRDQLTLEKRGYLTQFPQYPNGKFGDFVPRSGNQEGSGVLGWTYKCKGWETDPNAYVYVILQAKAALERLRTAKNNLEFFIANGRDGDLSEADAAFAAGLDQYREKFDAVMDDDFNTADARDRHKQEIWARIQQFCIDKTKYEVTELLSKGGVPVAPVLSTKEIMDDETLYDGNTLVKINQGGGVGEFVTVGVPFTLSNYQPTYGPCPTLGGNTTEILKSIGYTDEQIASFAANGTTAPMPKTASK